MTTAVPFHKQSPAPLAFNKAEGLLIGWLCFSDKDGAPYVDLHGDHFPADELFKAADELMAKPATERQLNIEHAGGGVGEIRTVYAVTPEIAKAHGWDTGGTYGLVGSVKPDAALMKSITDGDLACFSIEGKAHDVEIIKSEGADVAATAHKRTMRKVSITKLALVKAGAHEGAGVALIKTAALALKAAVAKASPGLTSADLGHQHLIADTDEASGCTSSEQMAGLPDNGWHSHLWVKAPDGALVIAMANGHTHTLATDSPETTMADDTAKSLEIAKARAATLATLLTAAVAMPPEVAAYAKSLPADKLEGFLALPEAERVAKATPIYKAADGTAYFASDDPRLVSMAKSRDEQAVEIAKANDRAEAVTFEKRADAEIPHLLGTAAERALVLKAIDGKPLTDAEKAKAREIVKAASLTQGEVFKAPGFGGGNVEPAGPQAELNQIATDLQKANPAWTFAKAKDAALETPRGRALYTEIERAKRAPATA